MKRSSAILLWAAGLFAFLCTSAWLLSFFYLKYNINPVSVSELRPDPAKPRVLPLNPDMLALVSDHSVVLQLSPVEPLLVSLAPLCWLFVYWKDRPALKQRPGRLFTWIVMASLVIFLGTFAWLYQHMTVV